MNTHERCERLVRNEVYVCLSSLVLTLAEGYGQSAVTDNSNDLQNLCWQAFDLASPVPDYEEAARQVGWLQSDLAGIYHPNREGNNTGDAIEYATDWPEACEISCIDPYEREVFEHWSISQQLAADLAELGEKVDTDFAGMCVWARTTTGQGIAQDGVIRRVVELIDQRVKEMRETA